MSDIQVGDWVTIPADLAMWLASGDRYRSDCQGGGGYAGRVVGLEDGWPVISIWGKRAVINPDLVIDHRLTNVTLRNSTMDKSSELSAPKNGEKR